MEQDHEIIIDLAEVGVTYIEYQQLLSNKRKRFRRWWSKPLIRYNYLTGYGNYTTVFEYFNLNDEEEFIQFTRMNVQTFEYLYTLVHGALVKRSKGPPLPPELRLSLTLNYLAYGDSVTKNKWFNFVGLSTVQKVIQEVCYVLCEVLMPLFVMFPTSQQFQKIAADFMIDLNFPNCLGAVDGRHCRIKKPPNSGSLFFNYKKFHSIVLMTCCDSKKRFIWANIGDYGSFNDAGIFNNSDLGRGLAQGHIDLPPPTPLPGSNVICPYFLIGDGGFGLQTYLMKPFVKNNNLPVPHRVYNFRLSHARRIIESAFGELSQRWRVNETALAWQLSTTEKIIMSTVCLHNMLIDVEEGEVNTRWSPEIDVDNNDIFNNDVIAVDYRRNNLPELRIRQQLANYFISNEGAVPWQWDRI